MPELVVFSFNGAPDESKPLLADFAEKPLLLAR